MCILVSDGKFTFLYFPFKKVVAFIIKETCVEGDIPEIVICLEVADQK